MATPVERLNAALEGRYRIERELGQGGMATVYLADDLKHERKVALKVLKSELAAVVGAARFLAEIKTTANLTHPNILPLHDSGEAEGFLFYVMPFVEGETLRARLEREHQLPVDDAVRIASDVAEALQYAHDHGVIHRDIKPANILVQAGRPLVADFGIALAVSAGGGHRLTETGLSLGTPHYMSPEQATGDQNVGPATDIYALGCVLYEMLVGEPPFTGSTPQAVLGKIITGVADPVTVHRMTVPANVEAAIAKALEKVPADRFRDAASFAGVLSGPPPASPQRKTHTDSRLLFWRRLSAALAGSAVLLVSALLWALVGEPSGVATSREVIAPMWGGVSRGIGTYTALAPDGSAIVFARSDDGGFTWQLYYRPSEAIDPVALSDTEMAQNVSFSPDATQIVFVAAGRLRVRPVPEGVTSTLAEDLAETQAVGAAWLDDGSVLFEGRPFRDSAGRLQHPVVRISVGGGPADTVALVPDMAQLSYLSPLPGSKAVLVSLCEAGCSFGSQVHLLDIEVGTTTPLLEDAIRAWYLPDGFLLFVRQNGDVLAVPFDAADTTVAVAPTLLFGDVPITSSNPELAVSVGGTLIHGRWSDFSEGRRELVWVDRAGVVETVDSTMAPDYFHSLVLSPSDDRVAATIWSGAARDVWVMSLPDGPLTRVTSDLSASVRDWSPDGRSVGYLSAGSIWETRADGSGARTTLLESTDTLSFQDFRYLPRGPGLIFQASNSIGLGPRGIDSLRLNLMESAASQSSPQVSPDGRWLAFVSNHSGTSQVYVRPFPSLDRQFQVSDGEARDPIWVSGRNELVYVGGNGVTLFSATYESDPAFRVLDRTPLFPLDGFFIRPGLSGRYYDVTGDGDRFLMSRSGVSRDVQVILVNNFHEELKRLVPN